MTKAASRRADASGSCRRSARALATLLLAIIVLAMAAAHSASAAEKVRFTLTGRGWGHGVGMSQWGAYGYARHGWTYRQILSHYYTGVTFGTVANDPIRVLLADGQSTVRLSAAQAVTATAQSASQQLPAATPIVVSSSGKGCVVKAGSTRVSLALPVVFASAGGVLQLANANQNGAANLRYRGTLNVLRSGSGGLMVVNAVPLEDYIRGVVPREVSATWPEESVKAQAVAARAFGATHVGAAGSFDVYCTGSSQAYGGADVEAAGSDAAVAATQGVVPLYKGKPITAVYFSSSGGHTENSENVWSGKVPYLRGVPDPYDTYAPHHVWSENPLRSITTKLGRYAPRGALHTIYVTKRGVSPRVVTAYAVGTGGATAVGGSVLRMQLGLRSAWIDVRSMSITRAAGASAVGDLVLKGRTYPELPAGAKLVLRVKAAGSTTVIPVPTAALKPVSLKLPSSQSARGTAYSVAVKPTGTATYTFAYGANQSPAVTVKSKPGLVITVPSGLIAGRRVLVNATVTPGTYSSRKVALQINAGGVWTTVGVAKFGKDGVAFVPWTPAAAGEAALRLYVAATSSTGKLLSSVVTVQIGAAPISPSPSPSPSALLKRLSVL
jgi:stage II sporulation protein D